MHRKSSYQQEIASADFILWWPKLLKYHLIITEFVDPPYVTSAKKNTSDLHKPNLLQELSFMGNKRVLEPFSHQIHGKFYCNKPQ